jgi:hypothetical protein
LESLDLTEVALHDLVKVGEYASQQEARILKSGALHECGN